MEAQAVIAWVIGTVVVLFVPALVWSTVIAGLYRESQKAVAQKAAASTK